MLRECDLRIFLLSVFPSSWGGSFMKAEEKLLILFTAVSIAATRTWDVVGVQYLNDGIEDCTQM